MNKVLGAAVLFGTVAATAVMVQAQPSHDTNPNYPAWAYAVPPAPPPGTPPAAPVLDDGKVFNLEATNRTFTLNKIRGRRDNETPVRVGPADWYPQDHPTMPKIVEEGDNARNIIACSLCHYPNGKGRSENAAPQGLPADYIVRQLQDMKNGVRKNADARKANTNNMINFAKAMTDQEIQETANYFASMKWTPWVRVVESETAPKVRSAGGLYIPLEGAAAGTEPIGQRVVEVPENPEHTEVLRNPRSGFIAYVPVGAVAKGKDIVTTGANGKTIACTICHGEDLNGVGTIPGIAARSPSYTARQLYDFQQSSRNGAMAALMKPVVAKLTNDDYVNITAYLASLPAPAPRPTQSAQAQ